MAAALVAVIAVVVLWAAPRLQPTTGTLVVVAAGRTATTLPSSTLMLRQGDGSWVTVGTVAGSVPAAPDQTQLIASALPVGVYDHVRLGDDTYSVAVEISAGHVEPLLLGIAEGRLVAGAVYAGNDDVNLGLGELSGKFVAMPAFGLVDQAGGPFNLAAIAGKDVVIAAFHTTCHETCPLYTALFLQLAKRAPPTVQLVEVTTDPATDTPAVLSQYAKAVGASWTFATGTSAQLTAFWKPFAVELATGDTHVSTLALVDRHGYVRLVYRGVPKVGGDIPPSLTTMLSPRGLSQLASGGDGWSAPDVLQALATIGGPEPSPPAAGGRAPAFRLTSTVGANVSLADFAGKPLVINFWATYCPPCKAEMPLLKTAVPRAGARLLLINEGESSATASGFLAQIGVDQPSLLDTNLSVGRQYGLSALPMTIFIKPDGTIDRRQIGQLGDRVLEAELSILVTQ
ncbi:MAG TPA: redoxin family protein [Candidatus Dormibacteraeota bacterium]|nr:redoxin family protein [Candidatus Dormibacteraeota bacterium]